MSQGTWHDRLLGAGALGVVLVLGAMTRAPGQVVEEPKDRVKVIVVEETAEPKVRGDVIIRRPGAGADVTAEAEHEALLAKSKGYWIGLDCEPAGETLRAQLSLTKDQGLVVRDVVPDGPAAKAGLLKHDVLLKAGESSLGEVVQLIEAVGKSQGKEVSFELIRGGKSQKIAVQPAKRPEINVTDKKGVVKWLERGQATPGAPIRLEFVHPGAMFAFGEAHKLPKNMSIYISKSGDEPAKIVVKQDDKSYETTSDKLDKLPPEVRGHVEAMLGGGGLRGIAGEVFNLPVPPPGVVREIRPFPGVIPDVRSAPGIDDRVEKRLQQMDKRFDELQKKLDELRKSLGSKEGR